MRGWAMLALVLAALLSAQQLEDQGRNFMDAQRFDAALEKLEAANRLASTPERLLAIAECHRELAYEIARAAALALRDERSMAAMAKTLDELRAGGRIAPRDPQAALPEAAIAPHLAASPQVETAPEPKPHTAWVIAGGAGTVALLAASAIAHFHAAGMVQDLSNPAVPDKPGIQGEITALQTGSNVLLGAGLILGAVFASLLLTRF